MSAAEKDIEKEISKNPLTSNSSVLRRLIIFLNPSSIVVGFILLAIEYLSGLFAQRSSSSGSAPLSEYSVLLVGLMIIAASHSLLSCFIIWFRQDKYLREDYSLTGLQSIFTLAFVVGAILLTRLMPWKFVPILVQLFSQGIVSPVEVDFADYALLILASAVTTSLIFYGHSSWSGNKSVNQHISEQQGEKTGLREEALHELLRLIKRKPPLEVYYEINRNKYIKQLATVSDLLAWKDRARELMRLTTSSYAFDTVEHWHDRPGCWLGDDIKTGEVVGLYPTYSDVLDTEISNFVTYSKQYAKSKNRSIGELIVAIQGESKPILKELPKKTRLITEAGLLDNLVDFRDYENEIRRRVVFEHLPYSDLPLDEVYVPSNFLLLSDEVEISHTNVEEYLYHWLEELGQRHLALLAEYGQGKSTAALMLTYHILFEPNKVSTRIPILIELRGRSPRNQTPLGLLGDWASQYRIEPQSLMRLLIAGRLLLIFEGFDEMALVGDTEMRLKHFKTLWQFSYPQSKILITGRPNFFLDEDELKAALGISKPIANQPYCEALRLSPFDLEQIQESLRNHKQDVQDQICSFAKTNSRFRELISRPSILHIVAVLWERENLSEQVDKLNSAYIMDLFVRYSYRRQGLKEADSPEFMALNNSEREYFMRGIAAFMASHELPNQLSGSQLNEVIDALIDEIPDFVSTGSTMISGETTRPLRLRLPEMQHGVEHVKTDVRACGILVDDPAAPGTFRFGHKSFMEYLFATVIAELLISETPNQARVIANVTETQINHILYLPVSMEFLAELVNSKQMEYNSSYKGSLDSDALQHGFAIKLLKAISGRGRLSYLSMRFSLMDRAFKRSANHLSLLWQFIAFILSPRTLLLSPLVILILITTVLLPESSAASTITFLRILVPLLILILSVSGAFLLSVLERSVKVRLALIRALIEESPQEPTIAGPLGLWNHLCKELGIQDKVMHRIAGTFVLPWAKNQTFEYFLRKTASYTDKVELANENLLRELASYIDKEESEDEQYNPLY